MPSRFEDVPNQHYELLNKIIDKDFPHLASTAIELIFDTKKRVSEGKIVLGRLQKSNDFTRHLSVTNTNPDGVDYFLYLDKNVFEHIDEADKIRLIRHELQHAHVDYEKTNPFGIRGHEINDFYDEIEYNKDDPRWAERLATIAESLYDPDRQEDDN